MIIRIKSLSTLFLLTVSAALAVLASYRPALADVTISTDPTSNMTCANGVCTPTAPDAVLNVNDLENMLANANVTLAAKAEPVDVEINAALSWTNTNALTLDSYRSIRVNQAVSVTGGGGLSIVTNDGGANGTFSFAPSANIDFSRLSSNLKINGAAYTLVVDVKTLASDSDIAGNSSGSYALAADYDASQDGTYSVSPVSTLFYGNFQGLGNTIVNLTISNASRNAFVGLFAFTEPGSSISNLVIQKAAVSESDNASLVGILVGANEGTLFGIHTAGAVVGGFGSQAGGWLDTMLGRALSPRLRHLSRLAKIPWLAALSETVAA